MATQPLQIPILADISAALQAFKKLQQNAKKTFNKISRSAGNLANIVTGFSSAVDLAKGSLDGLERSLQALVKTGQQIERAKFFNVQIEDAKALQKQFDGAISKATAFNTLIELQASGIGKDLAPAIAQASRALSFVAGLPRAEILQQLTSGEVSDDMLQKIGVRAGELALATQQRANALDRELTKYDRVKIALALINKGASRLGTTLETIAGRDIVNPITKLKNSLQDLVFGVLRTIAPEVNKIIKSAGGVDGLVKRIEGFVKNSLLPAIQDLVKQVKKALKQIQDEAKSGGKSFFSVFTSRMSEAVAEGILKGIVIATKKGAKGLAGFVAAQFTSSTSLASADFQRREEARLRAARQAANRITGTASVTGSLIAGTKGGKTGVSRAAQEIAAERAALASEARALTRNFLSTALDALSNLGGTISGVFSSLKDLPEKAKVFLATKQTREALLSVVKDIEKPLLQQLQLIRNNSKLTDQQKQAAVIFAIQSKAGLDDAREYLRNQQVVTSELKAANSFLTSNAQQAALAKQENDRNTDITTSLRQLEAQLEVLLIRRAKLEQQIATGRGLQVVRARAQLAITDQQIKRAGDFAQAYARQNALQKTALSFQRLQSDLERQQEIERLNRQSKQIATTAKLNTLSLQGQLLSAKGFSAQASLIQQEIQGKRQIADLDAKILQTQQAIQKVTMQAAADRLKGNKAAASAAEQRVAALNTQKTALQEQRDLQVQIAAQLTKNAEQATTFAGGFRQAFADAEATGKNFANALGQQLGNLSRSAIQFATDSLVKLGEGLGQLAQGLKGFDLGADFRQRVLSFLSDLAVQLGSFFIMSGTGLILTGTPDGIARGGALIGIGAVLATGGGFVKAFAGGTGAATSTAGINAIRQSPSAAPTRQQQQQTTETFILFNRAPWSLGTPEQEFRQFQAWKNRQSRTIGGR